MHDYCLLLLISGDLEILNQDQICPGILKLFDCFVEL